MNIEIALKEVNGREIPAVTSLQVAELKPERGKRPAHFKHPIAEMSVNDIYRLWGFFMIAYRPHTSGAVCVS